MHVLFVHQNFPAQFGAIAARLAGMPGCRATFISRSAPRSTTQTGATAVDARELAGVQQIQYHVRGGATASTHYCSRTFENATWHSHGIYEALRARPDVRPDLIVGHSGFCSTLFLRELYDCPIINYFEFFYRTRNSDMDFRRDFPKLEIDALRARNRNATLLLDLENCDAGYSPTQYQKSLFPARYQDKLRTIFDGVDTCQWRPREGLSRRVGGRNIPDEMKIVTYVSRGMESMRGFDIFMRAARLLCQRRRDVLFVVVGEDRVCYGGDKKVTGEKTFKQWVLEQADYDLSRFLFTGWLPAAQLAELLALTDLHIYLTVPFVLSWSLMNALACGATVLASDTPPVKEMIEHGQNGLLVDFFDVESIAQAAGRVLDAPADYRPLGAAGVELIRGRYSLEVCVPQTLDFYQSLCDANTERAP
jgi:glycosyltransferase involved in cell wall biosynthesis